MSKERGYTNLDARWIEELADSHFHAGTVIAARLKRIAQNIQKMDESLAQQEKQK